LDARAGPQVDFKSVLKGPLYRFERRVVGGDSIHLLEKLASYSKIADENLSSMTSRAICRLASSRRMAKSEPFWQAMSSLRVIAPWRRLEKFHLES
jgi:hypothetical protein